MIASKRKDNGCFIGHLVIMDDEKFRDVFGLLCQFFAIKLQVQIYNGKVPYSGIGTSNPFKVIATMQYNPIR
jgi:hypothetical protein